MPRLKIIVSLERSKNRAAMRKAAIRSPLNQALRIWSVLLRMSSTSAANARAPDDLAWLGKKRDDVGRNIRATAATERTSYERPLLGGKADIGRRRLHVR